MTDHIIHNAPGYRLTARITGKPPTLELYARHPTAQHPRDQRLLSLTLPAASANALLDEAVPLANKSLEPLGMEIRTSREADKEVADLIARVSRRPS